MITPRYNLSQTRSTLTINIRAPYCNLRELDLSVEENKFLFACTPYYLRLNLPGNIVDNDKVKSSFDSAAGEFTFIYEKETEEEFPNLDFVTTFLQPKTVSVNECGRTIEVLTSEDDGKTEVAEGSYLKEYGFALRGGYDFRTVTCEFTDIFNVDPYEVKFPERKGLRIAQEQGKFDREHYIADIMDDGEIKEIIKLVCPWKNLNIDDVIFTEKDFDFLKDLPNINHNLAPEQINYCHNSLVEILFAYCYDRRTTFYEGTCESDWTISTISASLSWFDSFTELKEAMICTYRRSLIYPLYRSFQLCNQVFDDLKSLLKLGNKYVIRCLIELHDIFLHGNCGRYVLNKLFINDYIVYMMKCQLNMWTDIVETVLKMEISKSDLGLNLGEIENSLNNFELTRTLANLQIDDQGEEDSDDVDTSDSESDSSISTSSGSSTSDSTGSDDSDLNSKART